MVKDVRWTTDVDRQIEVRAELRELTLSSGKNSLFSFEGLFSMINMPLCTVEPTVFLMTSEATYEGDGGS